MKNILLISLFAFLVRFVFFIFYPDQFLPDSITYEKLGKKLFISFFESEIQTRGIENKYIFESDGHMPLYSILSYILGGRINLIFFDIIISSLTVFPLYLLSKKIFNEKTALIIIIIFSIYPFSVFYSISGMTETIYVFLIITFFCLIYYKKYLLSFVILSLSVYLRATLEIFHPILIFSFFYFVEKRKFFKSANFTIFFIIIYSFIMTPWWIHNYIKYDAFVRTNLSMGEILYIGNNKLNKTGGGISGEDFTFQNFEDEFGRSLFSDPIEKDKILLNEALKFIYENPINFLNLSYKKFIRFWRLYPYAKDYSSTLYKSISIGSLLPIYIFSILSLFYIKTKNLKKFIPIFLFIFFLNFVHIVSISSIRYRFPVEPFLLMMAGYFIYLNLKKIKK